MFQPAPAIDSRTAEAIFEEVRNRLARTTSLSLPDSATEALIRIFARYGEILVDRLNRVPEKNLLAFLNLLGVSPIPAIPARVPLTFTAVPGATTPVRVPARTTVAAAPGPGETEPVLFETEAALELTPGKLTSMFLLDIENDKEIDLADMAAKVTPLDSDLFAHQIPSDHILYLAHSRLFGLAQHARLRIAIDVEGAPAADGPKPVQQWSILAGEKRVSLQPVSDTTEGFTRSGEIIFDNLPEWPESNLRGLNSRWLQAQITRPLTGTDCAAGNVRDVQLTVEVRLRNLPVEAAFSGYQVVDLTKDFQPLGIRPAFGSTVYLGGQAFSHPGACVTLNIKLTNPYGAKDPLPIPAVFSDGHPRLAWECWTGTEWVRLAETDSTKGFRVDGAVGFKLPENIAPVTVNGIAGSWIRVRLVSGNYGEEERWEPGAAEALPGGIRRVPATLSAPVIQRITVDYEITVPGERPDACLTLNQRLYEDGLRKMQRNEPFRPFHAISRQSAIYLGFRAPLPDLFANRLLTCYLLVAERTDRPFSRGATPGSSPAITWQYRGPQDWLPLDALDSTQALTRSGLVSFIVPDNIAPLTEFGAPAAYWFRISSADPAILTTIRGVLPNTTMATHALQIEKEVLGSSDGTPLQSFVAARSPILRDVKVQVREASLPSEADRILRSVCEDDVELQRDQNGVIREVWVGWRETEDLLLSRQEQRHFELDREKGEIRFGDGRHGLVPPRGTNNVRLRRYQVGGGARGNKAANTVTQLRTAIPYIQGVTNLIEAKGGFDPEPTRGVVDRGAKLVRHRGRAVTIQDFQDLALLASAEVAKAKCIPMRDLVKDPDGQRFFLGTLSLLIAPHTAEDRPANRTELLDRVREYLDERRDRATDLIITGPEFVPVSVEVEFLPESRENTGLVQGAIQDAIVQFLHPVNGGALGHGWDFGEVPDRAELYGVCASVPGVQSIRTLRVAPAEERPGSLKAGYFLVCSGTHKVKACTGSAAALSEWKQAL